MAARSKRTLEKIREMEEKYFNLVWLARKTPEDMEIPKVREEVEKVTNLYPEDVEELENDETNFVHGFNSGMLAASRLFWSYLEKPKRYKIDEEDLESDEVPLKPLTLQELYEEEIQQAEDEFPFLDT